MPNAHTKGWIWEQYIYVQYFVTFWFNWLILIMNNLYECQFLSISKSYCTLLPAAYMQSRVQN